MRVLRWFGWTVATVLGLVLLVAGVLPNTDPGRQLLARVTAWATGDMVVFTGLSGRFPDRIGIDHLEVRDAGGVWIAIENLQLDWSPTALFSREARVARLAAAQVTVHRLPASGGSGSTASGSTALPVRVDLQALQVDRLVLDAPVAGVAATLEANGRVSLESLEQGSGALTLRRLDGPGDYALNGRVDAAAIVARLTAQEPAGGLVGGLAGLPDLGALSLALDVNGPWNGVVAQARLGAGAMRATIDGKLDVPGATAILDVTADAPAMRPRADVGWRSVALRAHVTGPFTRPAATGQLDIAGLEAAGASLRGLHAELSGDAAGAVSVTAVTDGLRIPGAQPDLFAATPLRLQADIRLDAADRPVRLNLTHPLLSLDGTLKAGDARSADLTLQLPDFSGLGLDLKGRTTLHVAATMQGDTTALTVDGRFSILDGMAPAPALVGVEAPISAVASLHGSDVTLRSLHLAGARILLDARGGLVDGLLDANASVDLPDLRAAVPTVSGRLRADAHATGRLDALAADVELSGELATPGFPSAPVTASLHAEGLPGAPSGRLNARATLEGAALEIVAAAQRAADGAMRLTIDRADWKSAHAEGSASLPAGGTVPQAHIVARMQRLEELRALTGMDLAGSFAIEADIDERARAALKLEAKNIAGADSIRLQGTGPAEAMALQLDVAGMGATVAAAATLDMPARRLALGQLQAGWKGERLALLSPAALSFADGVAVDRLRLGLRGGVLELAGKLSPVLDVTASLRNLPAELANLASPDTVAAGILQGDIRLTGPATRPAGTVHLAATGLRLKAGPGSALPPAAFNADLKLIGDSGQLDARLTAGSSLLTIAGQVPLDPAKNASLRAGGKIDLGLLDPLLAADARRVRGIVAIDAGIAGNLNAPRIDGTLRLTGGEIQDIAQGVRLHNIQAVLRATGESIRIEQFSATAGSGSISVAGSVGLAAPMPLDIRITARNAAPLASEQLTAVLNADLTLRGAVAGAMAVGGQIKIVSADIRVPERLPTSIAVLNVRRPGDKPAPPATPGPDIGLDVAIDAPSRIFIRGRGIDAELAGNLRIRGTAAAPRPEGSLKLRRGQISVVGTVLTFTSGSVGLDGSGRIDPTLDFKATTSSGGILATLAVTGTASAPKLTLSSVPDLPQDEVLAHLLFGTSVAKLGPLQIAQIAGALAELAGVGGSGGFQPLESIRKGLGLDRLSVGSGASGGSAGDKTGTLEAGRYVAPGVYLGAKQGLSGSGTQATVQVDLYKGLKLETDVGTSGGGGNGGSSGSGGSSVGLTYQFDY